MSRDRDFDGKVVIVTGAGTGIGAATAELIARRGGKVVLVGRREAPLRDIAERIAAAKGTALVLPADVSSPADMDRLVANVVQAFGGVHGLVSNAGVPGEDKAVTELPVDEWRKTIEVNLSAQFYAMQAVIPEMLNVGGGAVVNVSSVFADRGFPQRSAYAASKHALRGLTRSAAMEWAAKGVRVNELQPGVIATPMLEGGGAEENERNSQVIPARRVGTPEEVAAVIAFLLSDEASYVVGAHVAVDGGFLA